jgi:hypothetical protein
LRVEEWTEFEALSFSLGSRSREVLFPVAIFCAESDQPNSFFCDFVRAT